MLFTTTLRALILHENDKKVLAPRMVESFESSNSIETLSQVKTSTIVSDAKDSASGDTTTPLILLLKIENVENQVLGDQNNNTDGWVANEDEESVADDYKNLVLETAFYAPEVGDDFGRDERM